LQKNSWTMPLPKKPEDTEVFKWLSGMKNWWVLQEKEKSYKFLSLFDIPNSVIKAIPPFISIITFHSSVIKLLYQGSLY
jgi:hypothetical protein